MLRLASIIYTMASATLMGVFIVVALTSGFDTQNYIVIAAIVGAVVAIPVSYYVAKAINSMG